MTSGRPQTAGGRVGELERRAVTLGDAANDRQAEAAAFFAGSGAAIEAVEHSIAIGRGDARPGVVDALGLGPRVVRERFPLRWLRLHGLPAMKRYPETPDELALQTCSAEPEPR